ncbi:uncharacterized protein RJT20DRAFT_131448 [Scheffersomyces xylosifermentans]|uniref:uncharacterized protein n=1 Tax=Scheffersomyces xylosifermentans TaxID=1304137 RepID=UPI00315C96FF
MSSTSAERFSRAIDWLNENAYWRDDLVIKPSERGGLGVFFPDSVADIAAQMDEDPLLLRIPKSNLLTPKNSLIFNLLVDYESVNKEVDLLHGMFSLILAVIYELSIDAKSPWFAYLQSIDFENSSVPVCLWDSQDKENLKNTEMDLLNLTRADELLAFYIECIAFAKANEGIVAKPDVLSINDISFRIEDNEKSVQVITQNHSDQLMKFGRIVSCVISRAFTIDNFHNLGMVPGADLFNHIEPSLVEGKILCNDNIHFVCDGDVCEVCGETDCDHFEGEESDDVYADSETESIEDDEQMGEDVDDDSDEEENGEHHNINEDGNTLEEDHEGELPEEELKEITLEYIKQLEDELENDSDAETIPDPEEVSTLSLSEDEEEEENHQEEDDEADEVDEDDNETFNGMEVTSAQEELAVELVDASKCCDVLLTRTPKDTTQEIFNSYGNELANSYLLHRYGFVTETNVNDTCLLSVQLFKYIKAIKATMSKDKVSQLEEMFEWFEEEGFEALNELLEEERQLSKQHHHGHGHDHEHEHHEDHGHENEEKSCEDGCCDEESGGCCDGEFGGCCDEDDVPQPDYPETWQLAARVRYDGTCTEQTYSILRLIGMSYRDFKLNILSCRNDRKLLKKIKDLFIVKDKESIEKYNKIISGWCKERLERYPELGPSEHRDIIDSLVRQEKAILKRFIEGK